MRFITDRSQNNRANVASSTYYNGGDDNVNGGRTDYRFRISHQLALARGLGGIRRSNTHHHARIEKVKDHKIISSVRLTPIGTHMAGLRKPLSAIFLPIFERSNDQRVTHRRQLLGSMSLRCRCCC